MYLNGLILDFFAKNFQVVAHNATVLHRSLSLLERTQFTFTVSYTSPFVVILVVTTHVQDLEIPFGGMDNANTSL